MPTVIKSRINNHEFVADFHIMKSISTFQPNVDIATQNWKLPSNTVLADPRFHKRQKVDILLGGDLFLDLLCVDQINSVKTSSQLSLTDTLLVGPTIQPDLHPTLVKFRLKKVCYYSEHH